MRVQEFVEFFHKHRCPHCEAVNWTYHSHSQRHHTGLFLNTDACKCHKCHKTYWLGYDGERQPTIQDGNPTSACRG